MKKRLIIRIFISIFIIAGIAILGPERSMAKRKAAAEPQAPNAISQNAIDAIALGDLDAAVIALRNDADNPKQLYLLREVSRLASFKMQERINKSNEHEVYQNVAIGYHNLYLFLKSRGIEQEEYFKEARKYYKKSRRTGTPLHKEECDLLDSAILAISGDMEKAEKTFSKLNESMLRGDFESMEYLAAYYAAIGDVGGAINYLGDAFHINPKRTANWLQVSDDFYKIENDDRFTAMKADIAKNKDPGLMLSVPKSKEPSLEMPDQSSFFIKKDEPSRFKKLKRKRKK